MNLVCKIKYSPNSIKSIVRRKIEIAMSNTRDRCNSTTIIKTLLSNLHSLIIAGCNSGNYNIPGNRVFAFRVFVVGKHLFVCYFLESYIADFKSTTNMKF